MGLACLEDRFIAVVSEAQDSRDLDGKVQNHDLVGWLDPAASPTATWAFAHQDVAPSFGTGIFQDTDGDGIPNPENGKSEPYAGTGWLAAEEVDGRLGVTFQEQVPGTDPLVASINNNVACDIVIKDTDLIDVMPVWLDFEGQVLDFDGIGFSVDPANAGIVVAFSIAYFRVDEAADNRDYNGDWALDDVVLMRNVTIACGPVFMATSSNVQGPVIVTDGLFGAAFLSSEAMAGMDLNGDGDMTDLVVQHFLF